MKLNKCGIAESLSSDSSEGKSYSHHSSFFALDIDSKKKDDIWRLMHILFLLTLRSQRSIVKKGMLQIGIREKLGIFNGFSILYLC